MVKEFWYQDSAVVKFLCIDHVVNGSNPPSAELSLRVRRVTCNSRRRNHEVKSHQEEGPVLDTAR